MEYTLKFREFLEWVANPDNHPSNMGRTQYEVIKMANLLLLKSSQGTIIQRDLFRSIERAIEMLLHE